MYCFLDNLLCPPGALFIIERSDHVDPTAIKSIGATIFIPYGFPLPSDCGARNPFVCGGVRVKELESKAEKIVKSGANKRVMFCQRFNEQWLLEWLAGKRKNFPEFCFHIWRLDEMSKTHEMFPFSLMYQLFFSSNYYPSVY